MVTVPGAGLSEKLMQDTMDLSTGLAKLLYGHLQKRVVPLVATGKNRHSAIIASPASSSSHTFMVESLIL